MKEMRFIITVCLGAVVLVLLTTLVPTYFHDRAQWERRITADALHKSFKLFREASEAFSRDQKGKGKMPPATVPLGELIAAGYFDPKEAQALKRHEVLVTIIGSDETRMAAVGTINAASERPLTRTELGNGYGLTLFLDGSVMGHSTRLTNGSSQ